MKSPRPFLPIGTKSVIVAIPKVHVQPNARIDKSHSLQIGSGTGSRIPKIESKAWL
jgi:hypothetical protein